MLNKLFQLVMALLISMPSLAAAATIRLPATGQTTCFDSNGTEIACAGTGQDGDKQAGIAWPVSRFADNGNGTVTDTLTGLVWSKHANAPDINAAPPFVCANAENDMSWQEALDFIICLNSNSFAGFTDWRLPNLNELESMVHAGVPDTSEYLSANGFGLEGLISLVQPSQYWSSTSDASFADSAWDVDFVKGDFPFSSVKIPVSPGLDTRGVWPVRGISAGPARLWQTGQAVCFNETGAATPCAGTGQDGENPAGAAWPAPRIKTNLDGTLALDRLTGLIWTTATRTPGPSNTINPAGCGVSGAPLNWQEALDHMGCLNRNGFLGAADWRLPNRKELRSLIDYSRSAPALPDGHPFIDLLFGDTYWTSTTDASQPARAWTVNMVDGSLNATGKINGGIVSAWPVSGPDLAPPALTINQGNMTINVDGQTIGGTVEAGAAVQVTVNGGAPAAATLSGNNWSFTVAGLAAGANAITVTAADFSENVSTASIDITFDATSPTLAMAPVATPTHQPSQAISGTVETGATVTVTTGGITSPATVAGATWSFVVTGLAAGDNGITVTATDAAGNSSTATAIITYSNTYTITAESGARGTISPSGVLPVLHGADQTFTFSPTPGYSVVDVLIDDVPHGAITNYTFHLASENHTIKAIFIPDGDLNNDGMTNITDVLRALQIAVGLVTPAPSDILHGDAAPVDGSGIPLPDRQITVADALMIMKKAVGITTGW